MIEIPDGKTVLFRYLYNHVRDLREIEHFIQYCTILPKPLRKAISVRLKAMYRKEKVDHLVNTLETTVFMNKRLLVPYEDYLKLKEYIED